MFDLSKTQGENIKAFFTKESSILEDKFKKSLNIEVFVKLTSVEISNNIESQDFFGGFVIKINEVPLTLYISSDVKIASILSDLMLMGPGETKKTLQAEDLDSLKELFSINFGAFATFIRENGIAASFDGFTQVEPKGKQFYKVTFNVIIENIDEGIIYQYVDVSEFENIYSSLKIDTVVTQEPESIFNIEDEAANHKVLSHTQMQKDNLDLLMDIELNARIRIGEKQMLLKDIVKLSEGTIIDLDKNVDEPMEILVNGKVIARGIVVVVGGNFGIKITHVGTKEERIKSLGG